MNTLSVVGAVGVPTESRHAAAVADAARAGIAAEYFDGLTSRAYPVHVSRHGEALHIEGAGIDTAFSLDDLEWPERTRHGTRVVQRRDGASIQAEDSDAWDEFARACGRGESPVAWATQRWRWMLLAGLVALALLLGALVHWGVPWIARAAVLLIPPGAESEIGSVTLQSLDQHLLKPSKLPLERQLLLRVAFERALSAQPAGTVPVYRLEFRNSRIGPTAFALPGGTIVLTDELVELVGGDARVITGVLAHELGHVRHHHGLRLLIQAGAFGALTSVVRGDFSALSATAPVVLSQATYSHAAEQEADAHAVQVLRAAGISPALMVGFFEKLAADTKRGAPHSLGIAIASHPADEERLQFFRDAVVR
jgi:Zn-dependent protease with chaperone function